MSIHSRLSNFEKSLQYRELALLWLKTAQGRSGFSDYWRIGEFQPWASENEEAGLMYHLAFEVNGAVITAAANQKLGLLRHRHGLGHKLEVVSFNQPRGPRFEPPLAVYCGSNSQRRTSHCQTV